MKIVRIQCPDARGFSEENPVRQERENPQFAVKIVTFGSFPNLPLSDFFPKSTKKNISNQWLVPGALCKLMG